MTKDKREADRQNGQASDIRSGDVDHDRPVKVRVTACYDEQADDR
jgi:hypothetical protein